MALELPPRVLVACLGGGTSIAGFWRYRALTSSWALLKGGAPRGGEVSLVWEPACRELGDLERLRDLVGPRGVLYHAPCRSFSARVAR